MCYAGYDCYTKRIQPWDTIINMLTWHLFAIYHKLKRKTNKNIDYLSDATVAKC